MCVNHPVITYLARMNDHADDKQCVDEVWEYIWAKYATSIQDCGDIDRVIYLVNEGRVYRICA